MKKIAFFGILTMAIALGTQMGIAQAQTPAPDTWSGLYVGPSIGWGSNRDNGVITCVTPGGVVNGTGCPLPNNGNIKADGGIAGGQLGYNFEFSRFVVGPEVSFNTTTMTGEDHLSVCCSYVGGGGTTAGTFDSTETIGWMAAAKLRLGYAFSEKSLLYATGGYARMNGNVMSNFTFNGGFPAYVANNNIQENGFIYGLGGEWMFQPRTSLRLEVSSYHFPDYTTDAAGGTGYLAGKHFHFSGYTVTGGVDLKI